MVSKKQGGDTRPDAAGTLDGLGRLVFRLATQLFGGQMNTPIEREPPRPSRRQVTEPSARPVAEAARSLEQGLAQLEVLVGRVEEKLGQEPTTSLEASVPQELTDLGRGLREAIGRLEDAIGQLGNEARRLSDEASRLSAIADRLERPADRTVEEGRTRQPATERETVAPPEPRFEPAEKAVDVVIAGVPGFQGLMDAQRGLSTLPAVEGASVRRYQNGEASLGLALRGPVTAREIVEGLQVATNNQLVIEEARPEASRLRLRFIGQEDPGFRGHARPEPEPNG